MLLDFRCARTGERHFIDMDSIIDVIEAKAAYANDGVRMVYVATSELQDAGEGATESIRLLVDKDDARRVMSEWIELHGGDTHSPVEASHG